jgi:acetylornithine/succinyldiaminopimelate/putrescine aminotransferase
MEKPLYKEGMGPFLEGITILPYNDPDRLRREVSEGTAAIFIEFLQGEGGIRHASEEFIREIERAQKESGALVVADEIQTGGGRTGQFFSFDGKGIRPDIVTLAKVIGGGLPLGAILATEALSGVWKTGEHGTTFGGNAVACAAGSAFLDLLQDGLMQRAGIAGELMLRYLGKLKDEFPAAVLDVRGAGCIVGVEFAYEARPIVEKLFDRGILANSTAGNVLRLLPPYIVEEQHIIKLIDSLREILSEGVERSA